jgi:prepilin-type N-terminal cleavage/methylation domain-containing protein
MSRERKGFTLIELLIVVVIIGILAAIAIPKFADTKKKAIVTAVKSDLKNLIPQAEAWYSDANTYANWTGPATGSTGVNITYTKDATGWDATATHAGASVTCLIAVGSKATGTIVEGVPYGANCK